jgi:hypothetical protein
VSVQRGLRGDPDEGGGPGPRGGRAWRRETPGAEHQRTEKNSNRKESFPRESRQAKENSGAGKCKLDKRSFAPCSSPKRYKVKLGRHKFSVRAVSGAATDPTPAAFSFKVKKKTKKH